MKKFLVILTALFMLAGVFAMQPARRTRPARKAKVEDKRIYLVHADVMHYDQYQNRDATVLSGQVQFRHSGARLFCDSAYFYEQSNSFEAFGHVKMYQGDTLSLFSDYAYYDGNDQLAQARYNVVLKHRQSVLYTDSLDYDRMYNFGYFFEGGKLIDNGSTLTSDWGEYHTDTKLAMFNYDVKMKNKDFYLTTDSLEYDTKISTAHIIGPSDIISGSSHIVSSNGYYDTKTEHARLFDRSVMVDNGRTMTGDSIYYSSKDSMSYAYNNIVYVDSVNKNKLTGDYCEYDESTGYAMATRRAVAIDFSQQDSLYMHADTFKIFTYNIDTDSIYRVLHAYNKVRAYRVDVQAVCDSLVYNSQDSCMTMYRDPIVWNNGQQLFGEEIRVYMRDSTVDRAHVVGQAFSAEQMNDSIHFNQVSSNEMMAYFHEGEIREADAVGNVLTIYFPINDADSTLILMNYLETTELKMFFDQRQLEKIWTGPPTGTSYPMSQIPPGKDFLPGYAWFDYIRPLDKDDIFNWRPKAAGTELKPQRRRSHE